MLPRLLASLALAFASLTHAASNTAMTAPRMTAS